jgi:hypothetical protein
MNKVKTEHECNLWVRENRVLCPFCMSGDFESIIWMVSFQNSQNRTQFYAKGLG